MLRRSCFSIRSISSGVRQPISPSRFLSYTQREILIRVAFDSYFEMRSNDSRQYLRHETPRLRVENSNNGCQRRNRECALLRKGNPRWGKVYVRPVELIVLFLLQCARSSRRASVFPTDYRISSFCAPISYSRNPCGGRQPRRLDEPKPNPTSQRAVHHAILYFEKGNDIQDGPETFPAFISWACVKSPRPFDMVQTSNGRDIDG